MEEKWLAIFLLGLEKPCLTRLLAKRYDGEKMLKRLSFLLLTGCMTNNSLTTMSMAQENIWNLSRLSIGMCEKEVLRVMDKPYKTQEICCDDKNYVVWFYVTSPSSLNQGRLVRKNVTPLTFHDGVLQGWGSEYYDSIFKPASTNKSKSQSNSTDDKRIEKVIQDLQSKPKTSQNDQVKEEKDPKDSDNESDSSREETDKDKKSPLNSKDRDMIEEDDDTDFNFW